MMVWECLLTIWRWLIRLFHAITTRNRTISISSRARSGISPEIDWETLRREVDCAGIYDLHNILRRRNRIDWCEWHLNIDENDKAIKIVANFHRNFNKLRLSSSIINKIKTIEETFLEFMPTNNDWSKIRNYFKQACKDDNTVPVIKAYTLSQQLRSRLNKYSATNTYHALKLYCTFLNCPILAQTQECTEAITNILFHPKLDEFLVRKRTVYRGIVLQNKKLIANYKVDATIITTTFLSTSTDPGVADSFATAPPGDMISIFCTYNINNTSRRTALDIRRITNFADEQETLILRYVPFTIKSIEQMDNDRVMRICFDECKE